MDSVKPHGTRSADDTSRTAARARRSMRRVAAASFTGTALEWYDYYLFGTAAALVFNTAFFHSLDPVAGTLASFATFAVGFVARPLGAAVFGHIGDRRGRRTSLLMTIVLMGVVTGLIGALPTYEQIGVLAPALLVLLRVMQGIAMGGEWSGASALINEHAPERSRGFYAVLPQLGNPVGILLGVGIFTLLSNVQTSEAFTSWGWRVPFLLAIPFALVTLWVRTSVPETPQFTEHVAGTRRPAPLLQILTVDKTRLAVGTGVALLGIAGYYFSDTFLLNHGTAQLGIPASTLLNAGLVASALNIPLFLLWGSVARRFGAVPVALSGCVATVLAAFPMFALVGTGSGLSVASAMVLGSTVVSISYAACGQILNELFDVSNRQSGIGLAYNLAGTLAGFTPFVATAVVNSTGGGLWATAAMLVVLAGLSLGSTLAARTVRSLGTATTDRATAPR